MNIQKDISKLLEENIITEETASKLREYYSLQKGKSNNRLVIVFGILGGLLVGLGIILILAHNWDSLARSAKTVIAFLPLIIGQIICGYTLIKKRQNIAWAEGSSVFLFFAIGASIALIGQIYNLPGDMSSFIITWMLLSLPLVYLLNASTVSIFYIIGITYYVATSHYAQYPVSESYLYWLLLLFIIPHYINLTKNHKQSNFTFFHNWAIAGSIVIALGTLVIDRAEIFYVAYMSLFSLYYLIGDSRWYGNLKLRNNGFKVIGAIGTVILLLVVSSFSFWDNLGIQSWNSSEPFLSIEFWVTLLISGIASYFLFAKYKTSSLKEIEPLPAVFIPFIPIFLLGIFSPSAAIFINIITLTLGIWMIRKGSKNSHLGTINLGLLIISALIILRFFDTNISFVIRGILFVLIGVAFFIFNYRILTKKNDS